MNNNTPKQMLHHVFHVDLTDMNHEEEYWLHVAGKKYAVQQHTAETHAAALKAAPKLQAMPGGKLTHFVHGVPMPIGSVTRISIRHTNKTGKIPGDFGVHYAAIHVVEDHKENRMLASNGTLVTVQQPIDYVSTAKSLLFHHADLITANADVAPIVMEHMDQFKAPATYMQIQQLAIQMRQAGPPAKSTGWANYQDYNAGSAGIKQTLVPTNDIMNNAGTSMTMVQVSTKNDVRLQGTSWTQEAGTSVQTNTNNNATLLGEIKLEGDNWRAALANTTQANGLQTSISVTDSGKRQVQVTMTNYYIRWLGAYVQFIDADGNAMSTPSWQPDDGGIVADIVDALGLNYDNMRFIGWINPINTIMAIPISSMAGELVTKITFPAGAVSAKLYGCGLGTGNNQYPKTPVIGGVFTGLANLGIPTFFLGFGVAAQTYKPLYDIMGKPAFIKAVVAVGVTYFAGDFIYNGAVNKKMDWNAFSSLTQILFTQGANKALLWCEAEIVEGQLVDEIPFAGWIMLAINIATTVAQLAQTIVEVATSPWLIPNSISTTIDSTLTINPDPRHKAFPQPPSGSTAIYVTKMIYKDQNRPTIVSAPVTLNPSSYPTSLTATFANTLGGQVKFEVYFYIDAWLAGSASTAWLANDEVHTASITLFLFQLPIPLNSKSIYKHTAILGYKNGAYAWIQQSTPPNATIADANTAQSGNAISVWTGLTLSQRFGMIGSSWKAAGMGINDCSSGSGGQLFGFENVNIPGTAMDSVKLPTCGFSAPTMLVYDVFPAKFKMENGNFVIGPDGQPEPDPEDNSLGDYYIDPRKADNDQQKDGGYHLRKVVLDATTPFNMSANQNSYGRFPYYPDSLALHPSGHAIGVNSQYCKMMVTSLAADPGLADDNIPLAITFAGQALNYNGSDGRAGLLFTPVAITCSYDGTILVLEQLQSQDFNIARVQAFDMNGNPVSCFLDSANNPSPFLTLPSDITYLDIAAVGDNYTTYMYVLYYSGDGSKVADYSMSLYQYGKDAPAGNLLVTTPEVPAAKLSVDMWHTMYTLNYQMTQDGNGNNAGPGGGPGTGPGGVTAPSVSEWLPPIPS